jgi:hypothetical protein
MLRSASFEAVAISAHCVSFAEPHHFMAPEGWPQQAITGGRHSAALTRLSAVVSDFFGRAGLYVLDLFERAR